MSKISRDNKKAAAKAAAEGKAPKGKAAKTAAAKKSKKAKNADSVAETAKPNILNYGKCCTCKSYGKIPDEPGHKCRKSGKPTARKASCEDYAFGS